MGCPRSSPSYRKSRYTVTSVDPSLGLILYSSFTGALARVESEQAPAVDSWLSLGTGPPEMEQELVAGGFIVPAGADEVSSCEQAERELAQDVSHLSLILLPTNDCNFRCSETMSLWASLASVLLTYETGTARSALRLGLLKDVGRGLAEVSPSKRLNSHSTS